MSQRTKKLLLAAIDSASEPERWLGVVTEDEIDSWIADAAFQLLGDNADCAPSVDEDPECENYPPDALFIEYAPNDPFQTPDLTPDGYLLPPWYNNPAIPLPGVLPGDAMVNFLALPSFLNLETIVEVGLPRVHIEFTGEGQVEIEFVKVIQGGYVRIVQDANELDQTLIDLNSQALADVTPIETLFDIVIGESLSQTEIAEFHFDTAGIHSLDITFFPQIGTDVIVGMGGGIRRVTLCGLEQTGTTNMPQFQVVDCELQWRPNAGAEWEVLIDLCAVQPPTIVRQDQTPPGNLEQNIGGAGYTEIANTDFLYRNGQYPMTGGLEINNVLSEVALTIYPQPSQVGDFNSISIRNKSNQQLFSISPSGQFTLFDPTATNYLQFYQTTGGNAVLTKHTTGSHQFLIDSLNTLVLQYSKDSGVSIGQTAKLADSILSVYSRTAAQIALAIKAISGQTLDLIQVLSAASAKLFSVTSAGAIEVTEVIGLYGQTSTQRRLAARIDGYWSNTTDATREGTVIVSVNDYAGIREVVRYKANGAVGMIGEYGHEPAVQQTVVGETYGIPALESLLAALDATGRIVNSTSFGGCVVVCEVPPEQFCVEWDMTTTEGASWNIQQGQWDSNGIYNVTDDDTVFFNREDSTSFHITRIEIEVFQTGAGMNVYFGSYDFLDPTEASWLSLTGSHYNLDYDFVGGINLDGLRVLVVQDDSAETITVTRVRVYGDLPAGFNTPADGTDCLV